jgi:ribosomal protein L7/L12
MNPTVAITGWSTGLRKVTLTALLQEYAGVGLAEAKRCTDDVLEGRPVVLAVSSRERAAELCHALREIGAQAEVRDAV